MAVVGAMEREIVELELVSTGDLIIQSKKFAQTSSFSYSILPVIILLCILE